MTTPQSNLLFSLRRRSYGNDYATSDIRLAEPDRYPVAAVDPHAGGRQRSPCPGSMAPMGTLAPAEHEPVLDPVIRRSQP